MRRLNRWLFVALLALALAIPASLAGPLPAHAAPTAIADCTFATLSTDLAAGGAYQYALDCADIQFPSAITIAGTVTATLDANGHTVKLDGQGLRQLFIVNSSGSLTLENSSGSGSLTISGAANDGGLGGAITNNGTLNVSGSTFSGNHADSGDGAAIYNNGTLSVSNSTFSGNHTDNSQGGGGAILNNGTLSVSGSTFSGNHADSAFGGAIYNNGPLSVSSSTFTDNHADGVSTFALGGAIFNLSGPLSVSSSTFTDNHADRVNNLASGGAIAINGGTVNVSSSTFSGNHATNGAGGAITNGGTLNVSNSTFSGNSADNHVGGAIANGGTLNVSNSTFSNNHANNGGSGGAIFNSATLNLNDSILLGNTASSAPECESASGADNILDDNSGCGLLSTNNNDLTDSLSAVLVNNGATPPIATLANNGGPTQTIALLTTSPAIDHGATTATCTSTGPAGVYGVDQRGYVRDTTPYTIATTCDTGAFELNAVQPTTTLTIVPPSSATVGALVTFNVSVTAAPYTAPINVGTATITSGGTTICTTGVVTNGMATCGSSTLPLGNSYSFIATYNWGTSVSPPVPYSITCPTLTLSPATSPALTGTAEAAFSQIFSVSNATSSAVQFTLGTITGGGGTDAATLQSELSFPAGTNSATSATLSGTPLVTGSFQLPITATDANTCTGSATYTLTLAAPTITVLPTTLAAATEGQSYTPVTFTASGGDSPYTFALGTGSDALPAGMMLDSTTGVLSGTPTQTGSFNLIVQATDAHGFTGSQAVTLQVNCATITLSPPTSPALSGAVNVPFSQTFSASAGTSPYSYALSNSTLPGTFSLNPTTGVLSGTPTTSAGSPYGFTIVATDSATGTLSPCTGQATYSLTIGKVATTTTLSAVPSGTLDIGQSVTYTAIVSPQGPSPATPSGSVTFTDSAATLNCNGSGSAVVTLHTVGAQQVATCTVSYPVAQVGSHLITATYGGDGNFSGSFATRNETVEGCRVLGTLAAGNQHLGIAASSQVGFPLHYLTFQGGAGSFVVTTPVIVSCTTPATSTASATIGGSVSSKGRGAFHDGDDITVRVWLVHGAIGGATVTDTTTGAVQTMQTQYWGNSKLGISVP